VIGPHTVGYRLTEAALVFGDRTITATGYAVAAGIAEKALAKVPPALAAAVLDHARAMIEDAVNFFRYQGATISWCSKENVPQWKSGAQLGNALYSPLLTDIVPH
jgi:hypothetical protein